MFDLKKGLGIWQILDSSVITDIIGKSDFDIILIDLEHGLHTIKSIQECVFAARASSVCSVVRLPNDNYPNIVQIIDTGIDAILIPHVETEKQLNEIINQIFLSPIGDKSFSPFVPKFNYGFYENDEVKNPSLGILVESQKGIDNAEILMKNSNVDFIYFGAYDLSVEISKPGDIFCKEILDILNYLITIAKKYNKKIMSLYRNKKELETLIQMKIDFPISSVDTSHFMQKLKKESFTYKSLK